MMLAEYVSCVDCGKKSMCSLCEMCYYKRIPCANEKCTARLNPNLPYSFCRKCKCTKSGCKYGKAYFENHMLQKCKKHIRCETRNCINIIQDTNASFCIECQTAWDKLCVRCPNPKKAKLSQCGKLMCNECYQSLPMCLSCHALKIKVDAQGKSYNYCMGCLCKAPNCTHRHALNNAMCLECATMLPLCRKLGRHGSCNRVKKSYSLAQCMLCCYAPKCTAKRAKGSFFCFQCIFHYNATGAQICETKTCFCYGQSMNTPLCVTCSETNKNPSLSSVKPIEMTTVLNPLIVDEDVIMKSLQMSLNKLMLSPTT